MDKKINRSAETGEFVTAKEAAEHPGTTVMETVRPHMTVEDIARTTYNVNRAYCESLGDFSFGPWDDAPEWQKVANLAGVNFHLANPDALPRQLKFHPCMMPFDQLPHAQQTKDFIFKAVVESLRGLLPNE